MLELFEPIVALLSWNSERKEKERELNHASAVLQRVARSLEGSVKRSGLLGKARAVGRAGPAEIELTDLGEGRYDLRCELPFKAEFSLEAAGFFQRLASGEEPVLSGEASPEVRRLASSLLRRFQGERLQVTPGRLEFRARPGADAGAILDLIDGVSELLEELV